MQLWFVFKLSTEAIDLVASNFSPWGNHTDSRENEDMYKGNELLHNEKQWLVSSLAELWEFHVQSNMKSYNLEATAFCFILHVLPCRPLFFISFYLLFSVELIFFSSSVLLLFFLRYLVKWNFLYSKAWKYSADSLPLTALLFINLNVISLS